MSTLVTILQRSDVNFGIQYTIARSVLKCRMQIAIYLKNCITKRWVLNCNELDPSDENIVLSTPIIKEEKDAIRPQLFPLLVQSPEAISRQIVECMFYFAL